jgi:general stress protein 26
MQYVMDNRTEEIDFNKAKDKLLSFLNKKENAVMVLATSANNDVMARPILIFNNDLEIYFFTWKYSRKCKQIKENNKISLCKDKVEIEGNAEIVGLMTSKHCIEIMELLRKRQPEAIHRWENKPNMVIVKISPTFACIDGYFVEDDAYIEYIDFVKPQAYRLKWGNY